MVWNANCFNKLTILFAIIFLSVQSMIKFIHYNVISVSEMLVRWEVVKLGQHVFRYRAQTIVLNTMRPIQNSHHFPDDIFKCIFFNENVQISIEILLKFVPDCLNNNILALVQIMAWRRPGDKPLSEPVMISLLKHICVTRPKWTNIDLSS